MENVETSSALTLRAYRLDLGQAFKLWLTPVNSPLPCTESHLITQARKALQAWSGLSPASKNRKSSTLKSFFGFLFREQVTERDLSHQVHSPKVPKKFLTSSRLMR
jgi:site-specific recombinase XerD